MNHLQRLVTWPSTIGFASGDCREASIAASDAHLRGLAGAVAETSALGRRGISEQRGDEREIIRGLLLCLALCLHEQRSEHIAPIMFPPFSLFPIGFGVVEPMGNFYPYSTV